MTYKYTHVQNMFQKDFRILLIARPGKIREKLQF